MLTGDAAPIEGDPPRVTARSDRGSALLLMPAAMLVVLTLAAITVDTAAVQLGRRELVAAADAAANDAVTYGLDEARLRRGEGYHLDRHRVWQAVLGALDARGLLDRLDRPPTVRIDGPATVTVELHRRVPYVFGRALPGARSAAVGATATADAASR